MKLNLWLDPAEYAQTGKKWNATAEIILKLCLDIRDLNHLDYLVEHAEFSFAGKGKSKKRRWHECV